MEKTITILLSIIIAVLFPAICFAEWVDADGINQEGAQVYNIGDYNNNVQLDLDSQGRPHIVFIENGGGFPSTWYLCYLYWDGSEWVDADGVGQESYRVYSDIAFVPPFYSFELNSLGQPGISWGSQGGGVTYYLYWNGSAWVDADGTGQESIQVFANYGPTSFRFRSDNRPSIFFDYPNGFNSYLAYLYWDGSAWVDADGAGQGQRDFYSNTNGKNYLNLINGPSNHPMVAWVESVGNNYDVYYLYYNGSAWVDADGTGQGNINVSNTGLAYGLSLSINSSDQPAIAWPDDTPGNTDIYYLFWNGSAWVDADGTGQEGIDIYSSSENGTDVCLEVNTIDNLPAIIWTENGLSKHYIYYLFWNGSAWVDADGAGQENIDIYPAGISGLSTSRSLSLMPISNYPAVAWADGGEYGLEYPYFLQWIAPNITPVVPTLPETGKNLTGFINRALGI